MLFENPDYSSLFMVIPMCKLQHCSDDSIIFRLFLFVTYLVSECHGSLHVGFVCCWVFFSIMNTNRLNTNYVFLFIKTNDLMTIITWRPSLAMYNTVIKLQIYYFEHMGIIEKIIYLILKWFSGIHTGLCYIQTLKRH